MVEKLSKIKDAENEVQELRAVLQQEKLKSQAIQEGFEALLTCVDFTDAANTLFNLCKQLTGAKSGYVALLSEDGHENEVLFLDSGGLPCSVDSSLPMPIRGLRSYSLSAQHWWQRITMISCTANGLTFMPDGHVVLKNVMFEPLW